MLNPAIRDSYVYFQNVYPSKKDLVKYDHQTGLSQNLHNPRYHRQQFTVLLAEFYNFELTPGYQQHLFSCFWAEEIFRIGKFCVFGMFLTAALLLGYCATICWFVD